MSGIRILKNTSTATVNTNSHGKPFSIVPKGSLTIRDSQADQIAEDLLTRYAFLKDITATPEVHVETKTVVQRNENGKRYNKEKKVVKKGKGKKA